MKKITIAIDGHSSCGKSTVAKELAKKLGYAYVDSGAMYRAITLQFIRKNISDFENKNVIHKILDESEISFNVNENTLDSEIFLNGENVEQSIRTMEVSNLVSHVSAISEVRKKLVAIQKQSGMHKGVVMDGRDIGTVVFPEAELKIFMTADPEIRAKRRFDELAAKEMNIAKELILKNLEERDYEDTHRKDSPLRKADDAVVLDNSNLTREQQLDYVVALVNKIAQEQ